MRDVFTTPRCLPPLAPSAVAALVLALGLPGVAPAAIWRVRPDGGGEFPTLQSAVDRAAEGDTVSLAPGTYDGGALISGKSLLLRGEGTAEEVVLDAGYAHRILEIRRPGEPVVVQDLTFRRGRAGGLEFPDGAGGGILALVAPLVARRCVFDGNTAESIAGAIYCTVAFLPGIGDPLPTRDPADLRLLVEDCLFTSNHAANDGGAIHTDSTPVVVRRSVFRANGGLSGGAMDLLRGSALLEDSRFEANLAALDGGALRVSAASPWVLSGCDLAGNVAGRFGGAALVELTPDARVSDTVFSGGSAGYRGGGLHLRASALAMERTLIATSAAAEGGGGAWIEAGSDAAFTRCTWYGNAAGTGASVRLLDSTASFDRCLVADDAGAPVDCFGDVLPVATCTFGLRDAGPCLPLAGFATFTPCAADPRLACGAPGNATCGTVGHADDPCPEGSCDTAAEPVGWGALKLRYR